MTIEPNSTLRALKRHDMSAYIVDKPHIDALVAAAIRLDASWWHDGDRAYARREDPAVTGQMLVDANVESVSHRYPDDKLTELPGRLDAWWLVPYTFPKGRRPPSLTAVAILKAIDCYEYQACEPPGWETSEAAAFCRGLRDVAIGALPGYDEAAWEITGQETVADPRPQFGRQSMEEAL